MASDFVDLVLRDIDELLGKNIVGDSPLKELQISLRHLRTFLLCARNWNDDNTGMGSFLSRLEDALIESGKEFHNLCLGQKIGVDHMCMLSFELHMGIVTLMSCIRSFGEEITEFYITLRDCCSLPSRDQSTEFIRSLLVNMAAIRDDYFFKGQDQIDSLEEKLVFFINFIRFAELRDIVPWQLQDLLTHLHVLGINTAILCQEWTFLPNDNHMHFSDEFQSRFSELLQRIRPVDPRIRLIYIHILTASDVSPSSRVLTLETGKQVLGDFIDSLLFQIVEALSYGDSYMISLNDQVPILYEGLRFLRSILTNHPEKIDELPGKAKDLIGAAVNEAAIVICSLPVDELEEDLVKKMNFALRNFLERIKLIKVITSKFIFSKTNEHENFVDFLLESLKELLSCTFACIAFAKNQIQTVQEDLVFLRSLLESILDDCKHDGKHQSLWNRVVKVACNTHFVILSLVVGDIPNCSSLDFEVIIKEIDDIKQESLKIVESHYNSDFGAQKATNTSNPLPSQDCMPVIDILVTLNDEAMIIIRHLIKGPENLDIISIVGMPGLGKTTLARSVYDYPSIRDRFHVCAWGVVSQVYKMKDLLLGILVSIDPGNFHCKNSIENQHELEEILRRRLLKKRYLIILDDVWDTKAWRDLERSLPKDKNSSRILLTSRHVNVAKTINPKREPYQLRHLTDDECWDLLKKKLPCNKNYPSNLGKKIASYCKGLPLTVVIVSGILAELEKDGWEKIARRQSLSDLSIIDQCRDIFEASYRNLPENLKSCLLYFVAFPEGKEIPSQKLIRLWIAEGFVQGSESKSLEDVAKDYMNDLIGRSLVMVSKKRSLGGVKTCRIHDLLRKFCAVKAEKEKFVTLLIRHDDFFTFHGHRDLQRLCVHSTQEHFVKSRIFCPGVRSLLLFSDYNHDEWYKHYNVTFIFHLFKPLKVLGLENINLGFTFPIEITSLVELRYLAIKGEFNSIPSTVANLSNLENLLVYANNILLPDTIWNMQKLRVLWSFRIFVHSDLAIDNLESSHDLHNLDTFSTLELCFGQNLQKIMTMLPNIRRLKCEFHKSGESNVGCRGIVAMDFLSRLESLHLRLPEMDEYHIVFRFPVELKKLTLSGFHPRTISNGGELLNLVVLKLWRIDFEGGTWNMNEEWEFPNLKLLELNALRIVRWIGSDGVDHFPFLEKLVLQDFQKLKEVPCCLWDRNTLQLIKVRGCDKSVASLFLKIGDYQKDYLGNKDLQVLLE